MPDARAAMAQTLATEYGLPIIFLREGDKRPIGKGAFEAQATRDPEVIQRELGNGSRLNYGIAWGPAAGMFALDVDEGGTATIAGLEWELGPLPVTWRIETQSGNYQDIFPWPHDGGPPIRNRGRFAPSLDVRGQGGQSVGPGSEYVDRSTGEVRPWKWAPGRAPWEIPIAEMPAAWLALIRAEAERPEPKPVKPAPPQAQSRLEAFANSVMQAKLDALASAPDGEQEQKLGHASLKAGSLISRGWISRSYCEQAIVATLLACQNFDQGYPWTYADATHKVARGIEAGLASPEPDPPWLDELEARERPREHLRGIDGGKANSSLPQPETYPDNPWREVDDMPEPRPAPERDPFPAWTWKPPEQIPRRDWLYERLITRRYVTVLAGPSGIGKSLHALQVGLSLASGKPLLGQACRRLRVGYWNGEDPQHETDLRIAAVCQHHSLGEADLAGWFYCGSGRDAEIVLATIEGRGSPQVNRATVEDLVRTIKAKGLDVVIADPFVSTHRTPENDNNAQDLVLKTWAEIAERCNVGVVLVHHTRKTNGEQITIDDVRGGGALVAAARTVRLFNQMTEEEARKAGVHPDRRRSHFRVDHGKSNLAPPSATTWFQIIGIDLQNGDPEEGLGDSVGILVTWKWPLTFAGITADDTRRVMQAIAAEPDRCRDSEKSPQWVGFLVAETLDLDVGEGRKVDDRSVEQHADRAKVTDMLKAWRDHGYLISAQRPDSRGEMREWVTIGEPFPTT